MTPEGFPDKVVEKISGYYFGLRDWFLQIVKAEREEFRKAQNVEHPPALVLKENDDCPECGTAGSMREIPGAGSRCMMCAFQPRIYLPAGSPSRKDLETWQNYSPEHKSAFQKGFGQAISRIVGRK